MAQKTKEALSVLITSFRVPADSYRVGVSAMASAQVASALERVEHILVEEHRVAPVRQQEEEKWELKTSIRGSRRLSRGT